MKMNDLFPGIDKFEKGFGAHRKTLSKMIVAARAPTEKDGVHHQWWYDRKNKVMYVATEKGYVKD